MQSSRICRLSLGRGALTIQKQGSRAIEQFGPSSVNASGNASGNLSFIAIAAYKTRLTRLANLSTAAEKQTVDVDSEQRLDQVLTHLSKDYKSPNMVDISSKASSVRTAMAQAKVVLPPNVYKAVQIVEGQLQINSAKGPVLNTAIVAGVMAAKKTSELIPFCHPISIDSCDISFSQQSDRNDSIDSNNSTGGGVLLINVTVKTNNKTGVEMEALVSASTAALTVYDMLKAISHDIEITDIRLLEKKGGKSDFKYKNLS